MQDLIADISVDADAARLLAWRVADLDRARRAVRHRRVQGQAVRLRGRRARPPTTRSRSSAATGTSTSTRSQKYLRDARVMTLYEGTSQIQKLLIGRAETGVNAFL